MAKVSAFVAGSLFALGLGLGGMTQPEKIRGFLDVLGVWDASLAFVMLAAVLVYAAIYRVTTRRAGRGRTPWLGPALMLPTRRDIDGRLVLGASLFGVGWGLAGYCPGPAVVSLPTAALEVFVFVGALMLGLLLPGLLLPRRS